MTSEEAAKWLMENIADDDKGDAIILIPHRSWKREQQLELAHFYLSPLPLGGPKAFEAFASIMSLQRLIDVVREQLPCEKIKLELFAYHFFRVVRKTYTSDKDVQLIEQFNKEVEELTSKLVS